MAAVKQTPQSIFYPLLAGTVIIVAGGTYFGIPLGGLLFVAALAVCVMEPKVQYTGPKDKQGLATPIGDEETRNRRYQTCRQVLTRLLLPGPQLLPGKHVNLSWLAVFPIIVLATLAPIDPVWTKTSVLASPLLVAHVWLSVTFAVRKASGQNPKPALSIKHATENHTIIHITGLTVGIIVGIAVIATLTIVTLPWLPSILLPTWTYGLTAAALTILTIEALACRNHALEQWREEEKSATMWETMWQNLAPKDIPPVHVSHQTAGPYTVDEFMAIAPTTAETYIGLSTRIAPLLGAGYNAVVLASPVTSREGNIDWNNTDPGRFRVAVWTEEPDLTQPTDIETVRLAIDCEVASACDSLSPGSRILVNSISLVSPEGEPVTETDKYWWIHQLAKKPKNVTKTPNNNTPNNPNETPENTSETPDSNVAKNLDGTPAWCYTVIGISEETLKTEILPNITIAGLPITYDPRYTHLGLLANPQTMGINTQTDFYNQISNLKNGKYAGPTGVQQFWQDNLEENIWRNRWDGIKEVGSINPPTPQPHLRQTATLNNPHAYLTSLPFATRQGIPPSTFLKLEPKIATVLGGAPFVSIVGYTPPNGHKGDRHPQGIVLRWSNQQTPTSPMSLTPPRNNDTTAQEWILAGAINRAFDATKLPRPELIQARPLTAPTAGKHLWEIRLRLYDSLTVPLIRKNAQQIGAAIQCPWIRAIQDGPNPSQCVLIAGAHYRDTQIVDPEDLQMLQNVEWAAAWEACGVTINGALPEPVETGFLPTNHKVEQLIFKLPPGLDVNDARRAEKKLTGATGNQFIQIKPDTTPSQIEVLACKTDPMPFPAPFNWDLALTEKHYPFATGVDGAPVCWDPNSDPHLLVVGTTGGGKSTFAQTFLYPLLARDWEVVIIDPIKKAADFKCYLPWCVHVATSWDDATATIKAVKAEQNRRFDLYRKAGVQDIYHLPPDQKPPELLLVIDEFNSAVAMPKPDQPADNTPETIQTHIEAEQAFTGSKTIGAITGNLAAQGRSAGIHILLAGQRVTAKTLEQVKGGEVLRTNLGRILLGNATYGEKQSALRSPDTAPDLGAFVPKGRGIFESVTGATSIIQSWYPDDGDPLETLPKHLRQVRPVGARLELDIARFATEEATAFEGKIINTPTPSPELATDLGEIDLGIGIGDLQ